MQSWVKDFLELQTDEKISREEYLREISVPAFGSKRLSKFLTNNFSRLDPRLSELFGQVLGRLPMTSFLELLIEKNLFFILLSSICGISPIRSSNFGGSGWAYPVFFEREILQKSDSYIIGCIIHELSHLLKKHHLTKQTMGVLCGKADMEVEANLLACELGFEYEISKIRKGGE